jgi:dTMP kinase
MTNIYKGKFIVLDGIDYCGKGSHITALANYFFSKSKESVVVLTREPTMLTEEGKEIRKLLATMKSPREAADRLFYLYPADRKKHVNRFIIPCMSFGAIVISDRYKYSTIAYQGAQGIPVERTIEVHKEMLIPDLALILDITPEEYVMRAVSNRRQQPEVFDKNKEFIRKVRQIYLEMPELLPNENIKIISSMSPFEEVHPLVVAEVEKIMLSNSKSI